MQTINSIAYGLSCIIKNDGDSMIDIMRLLSY